MKPTRSSYDHIMQIVENRPLDINIELINFCPMACKFCCNKKIKREQQILTMDLFKKICVEYIEIGGGSLGLSSMQSDVFLDPLLIERLNFLRTIKENLYIYTTNPLISIGKYTDAELTVILETLDYIQVSVLGINEEEYYEMGGINSFNTFLKNLYRVKEIKDRYKLNLKIDLYFRTCNIQKLKKDSLYNKLVEDFSCGEMISSYFDWFGTIKKEDLPTGAKLISKINVKETQNCAACVSTLAVNSSGRVVGCGCIDWNSKYIIGDCAIARLEEIWNSRLAKDFRQAFSHNDIPDICKNCGLYVSIQDAYGRKSLMNYKVTDGIYYKR